jgi:hypothetical protein
MVDEIADAVCLVADQARQRSIRRLHRFFEQLCGAPNTGERIFDLMRQHRCHAVQRAHRATMKQLPVEPLREAALVQGDDDIAVRVSRRSRHHIGRAFTALGSRQIDIALAHRGIALLRLSNELEDRTAERHQLVESLAGDHPGADGEELLGRRVDGEYPQILPDEKDGHGEDGENLAQTGLFQIESVGVGAHGLHIKWALIFLAIF